MPEIIATPDLFYSARKLFTGLAIAAFIVCTLNTAKAIRIIPSPLIPNTHQLTCVLKAKPSSHLLMDQIANGVAIKKAIATNIRKSLERIATI